VAKLAMLSRKRLALLIAIIGIAAVVGGVIIYFCFFYGKEGGFFTSSHIRFYAYSNDDADTKMNASSKMLVEFSSSDYAKVASNDTVYVWMRADQDDWDGMHFIFDLSGYNLNAITSIRFTWIGRIIEPESCDFMELWYYKNSGWVKFDDINQSVWMTKMEEWTSNIVDYVDANGKVHISVLIHVMAGEPLETISAYVLTQFVNLEVSYLS
jgi:hypothetical protein